jgi:hypothetical protein
VPSRLVNAPPASRTTMSSAARSHTDTSGSAVIAAQRGRGGQTGTHVSTAVDRLAGQGLLAFDPSGVTGHPDHRQATAAAFTAAAGRDLPVPGWTLPTQVAETLGAEYATSFSGHPASAIDLLVTVDRARQRAAVTCHTSQALPTSVLWRRLDLLRHYRAPALPTPSAAVARRTTALVPEGAPTADQSRHPGTVPGLALGAAAARHVRLFRRNCNVNLDNLRCDRPDLGCEPLQARDMPRNLQLDATGDGDGTGFGGVWARCGGDGWGECGEATEIFGWERNLGVENRWRHEDLRTESGRRQVCIAAGMVRT